MRYSGSLNVHYYFVTQLLSGYLVYETETWLSNFTGDVDCANGFNFDDVPRTPTINIFTSSCQVQMLLKINSGKDYQN